MSEQASSLPSETIIELTAEIVSSFIAKNAVPAAELPNLIASVHSSLMGLGGASAEQASAPAKLIPAVPIKKSVTDDFIISLEDGRKFKSLKRYLATSHGMTPADYRAKWGLPHDYPMVAPSYAKARSNLAKTFGLGAQRRKAVPTAITTVSDAPEAAKTPKRGRKKAAA